MTNYSKIIQNNDYQILFLDFILIVLCLFFTSTALVDDLEHLRASYFVSQGYIPYRDFFEHHHPLIWYIFAPIIKFLPHNNLTTLYIAKTFASMFSVGSTYLIYIISKKFFGGKKVAITTLLIYFMYYPSLYTFSAFKPDTFARFFYLLGLYNFFLYTSQKKTKNMVITGISLTISFLFLQTTLFVITPLLIPLCYFLYKNKQLIKNFILAIIPALLIIISFTFFLYYNQTLEQYFQLNWIFNSYLYKIIIYSRDNSIYSFAIFLSLPFILYFFNKKQRKNFFINSLFIVFCFELIKNLYYSTHLPHYLVYIFLFSSVITSSLKFQLHILNKIKLNILFIIMIVLNLISLCLNNSSMLKKYYKILQPTDTYVLYHGDTINIYAPKTSYYWFNPQLEGIDNGIFKRFPDYNINEFIKSNNITYIIGIGNINKLSTNLPQIFDVNIYNNHILDVNILNNYKKILPHMYKLQEPFSKENNFE